MATSSTMASRRTSGPGNSRQAAAIGARMTQPRAAWRSAHVRAVTSCRTQGARLAGSRPPTAYQSHWAGFGRFILSTLIISTLTVRGDVSHVLDRSRTRPAGAGPAGLLRAVAGLAQRDRDLPAAAGAARAHASAVPRAAGPVGSLAADGSRPRGDAAPRACDALADAQTAGGARVPHAGPQRARRTGVVGRTDGQGACAAHGGGEDPVPGGREAGDGAVGAVGTARGALPGAGRDGPSLVAAEVVVPRFEKNGRHAATGFDGAGRVRRTACGGVLGTRARLRSARRRRQRHVRRPHLARRREREHLRDAER